MPAALFQLLDLERTPTGDAAFDARFSLSLRKGKGDAPAIGPEVRRALLRLPPEIGNLDVSSGAMSLRSDRALSAATVEETIAAARRVIALLQGKVPDKEPSSAYRG
jgi:hypothetical protein